MIEKSDFGARLKKIRESLNLKQKDFAHKLEISSPAYSEIEAGKYKPGMDFLEKLLEHYGVNPYFILLGLGDMFILLEDLKKNFPVNFFVKDQDSREFFWYFEKSSIVRYFMMGHFKTLLLKEYDLIIKEVGSPCPTEPSPVDTFDLNTSQA